MKYLKIAGLLFVGMFLVGAVKKDVRTQKVNAIKATFVELGSVNCIPCKAMQPVMKEIEAEYGNQVKVVFYDVWTAEGKIYGEQYGIRAIPTQVFLDKDGKEYFRHMGFFPKDEIVKVLEQKGVRKSVKNVSPKKENETSCKPGQICK